MKSDKEILSDLIFRAGILQAAEHDCFSPQFETWYSKTKRFLKKKYGASSDEFHEFFKIQFSPLFGEDATREARIDACNNGLERTILELSEYLDEEKDKEKSSTIDNRQITLDYKKVFIVHGHDGELKESVARLLSQLDIHPIILNEQENHGKTIIEKIECNTDVGAAIVLFTNDDIGREKSSKDELPRARQNVVFEAGYFMGKLGRDRVIIISEKGVELPSDLHGMGVSDRDNWKLEICNELKALGFSIDKNKL